MNGQGRIEDTPSIVHREITSVRVGERLSYAQLTGREKRDYLFDEGIRATAYAISPGNRLPNVELGLPDFLGSAFESITHQSLSESITRVGDELEPPKRKLFHTYGTTAKIVFTPKPAAARYTGLFTAPAPGLARFSYAGPVSAIGIVPGLGLKFPVDGVTPSADLVVMRMLDPQQGFRPFPGTQTQQSVFQNAFTNFLPDPSPINVTMQVVKRRFETVVVDGEGLHQTLDSLARVCADGSPVPAEQAAPYRLIFRPTAEATAASDPTIDFRDDLANNIAVGTPIYDILALDESDELELRRQGVASVEALLPDATEIGTITTESEFIASTYGDYRLFFRHSDRYVQHQFKSVP